MISFEKVFEIITEGKKEVKRGNKKIVYSNFNPKSSNPVSQATARDYLFCNLSRLKELESDLALGVCSCTP